MDQENIEIKNHNAENQPNTFANITEKKQHITRIITKRENEYYNLFTTDAFSFESSHINRF